MDLARSLARWIRRCFVRITASARDVVESDLQDLELTMRKPSARNRPRKDKHKPGR